LYADLVEHLEKSSKIRLGDEVAEEQELDEQPPRVTEHSASSPQSDVSYANLFQDVRNSMDFIHGDGSLKAKILADIPKYIKKVPLAQLLTRLRQAGRTCFLLTNSEYYYTHEVMKYLLEEQNPTYDDWKQYWDIIIVGANKPRFFAEGTTLREVSIPSGNLKITTIGDHFERGKVYHGGSMSLFQKMTGAKGSKVLYTGDHIFADIIKSKKVHGWRNLLVVPELQHELTVWGTNQAKYNHLINLEFIKAELFRDLDSSVSSDVNPPDLTVLRKHIKQTNEQVNKAYNSHFGSLFRSGSKPTFFAMQVQRYADLYTSEFTNLLNYPLFYEFTANNALLPHEYHPVADLAQSMS
jgi:5'-nucleotidase